MSGLPILQYPDERPRTRGACATMPRPCPFVSCRYHLAHDWIQPKHGPRPTDDDLVERIESAQDSCCLDVADRGEKSAREVALAAGVRRQRIDQVLEKALTHAHKTVDETDARAALETLRTVDNFYTDPDA